MAFTAKDVQTLREQTGAGMMDCKKALTASDGDFEKAIEFLREKGLAAAAKKSGRIAAEGVAYAMVCDKTGIAAVVEINSETDFVAKNDEFKKFCSDVCGIVMTENPSDLDALANATYPGESKTVEEVRKDKVLTIGENIQLRRFERYDGSTLNTSYIHADGKIGVLVGIEVSDNLKDNEAMKSAGKDVCMQVAAMRPQWLLRDDVPADTVEKEKKLFLSQSLNQGKTPEVAEKMVAGRINKFYQENCLVDQAFVKENKISVSQYINNVAKENGGTAKITKFTRFERGEGIEKKEDNFAEEIAKLTGN